MKIDLSIFMSCEAGFLLTISLLCQQEVMFFLNPNGNNIPIVREFCQKEMKECGLRGML